jgi:aryl-alcohol dehydrogenase-like predicted oxidoreductase
VHADQYDQAVAELVPAMLQVRDAGKIRLLSITESFASDPRHSMLARAVRDDYWDVVMVGFNMLNQSARERVLTETRRRGTGVLCISLDAPVEHSPPARTGRHCLAARLFVTPHTDIQTQ